MALEASNRPSMFPARRNTTSMRVPRHHGSGEDWPDHVDAAGSVDEEDQEEAEERRQASQSWMLLLLTCGPLLVACVLLGICCFGSNITGSMNLLELSGDDGDLPHLWLSLSGYCIETGSKTNCSISALNTFYKKAYNSSEIDVGELKQYLPEDFGADATLLLISFICSGVAAVFVGWAAFDLRKAQLLERQERRSWVAEWIQARRLEMLGVFFAAAAVTCGLAASTNLTSATAAANATVNAFGENAKSDFSQSSEGSILSILYSSQACAGFTILSEIFALAYDGLMRRVRFEYEMLIDDLDAFSRDDFVVLQTRLNKMHALSMLQLQSSDPAHKEQIRAYLLAYCQRNQVEHVLRRQKALIMAQESEFVRMASQARGMPPISYGPEQAPPLVGMMGY